MIHVKNTRKAFVAATATLLFAGTAAAAAGGALPGASPQRPSFPEAEITTTSGDTTTTTTIEDDGTTTTTTIGDDGSTTTTTIGDDGSTTTTLLSAASEETGPVGPDANGPAKHGLCVAWAAGGVDHPKNERAIAFRNLRTAAEEAGSTVEEFCADVLAPEAAATADGTGSDEDLSDDADDQSEEDSSPGRSGQSHGHHGKSRTLRR